MGRRFGDEALFIDKRFFCHFHARGTLLLETFVWDKVNKVVNAIPGVIPHPQYGAYGWVRLRVSSTADLDRAKKLIEMSYRYVISTKRISLPKTIPVGRTAKEASKRFPTVQFRMKPSAKRIQVIMSVRNFRNAVEARKLLNEAGSYLRKRRLGFPTCM